MPDSKFIIEQKSLSENLTQEKFQFDGSTLTPYEQAQRYGNSISYSMHPRWIVVCNFAEFLLYDMETLVEPTKILLKEFHSLDFLDYTDLENIHKVIDPLFLDDLGNELQP